MPNPNGTAVVMNNVINLEQHLYILSVELNTNLFEIVPVQLIACETNSGQRKVNDHKRPIRLKSDRESKKRKRSEETDSDRQIRLQKANEFKRRKQLNETDSNRLIRLEKDRESKKRKKLNKSDSKRQLRLEKDRLCHKQKRAKEVAQQHQCGISQQDYLNMFDNTQIGGVEEKCWAKANMNKFHKSVQ